jgi:hypothetical protein
MHTPKRRSASPHIGRLRPLNPSARTPLQSLPPCARRAGILPSDRWQSPVWASEPKGQPHFPLWPDEPSQPNAISGSVAGWPNEPDRQISRRLPDEPDRRPRFVQANRIRHIGTIWAKRTQDTKQDDVTSPIARIRQRKPPHEPAVLWPNEPERPPTSDWAEMADWAERTQRPRHARSQSLLPFGSIRILAFRLKILPYFSCCLQGAYFCARYGCTGSQPSKGPLRRKAVGRKESRGAELTRQPGCFGPPNPRVTQATIWPNEPKEAARSAFGQTIPRGSPVTPVAKQTQGAPSHDFGQTNPSCRPVRVFAKRTRGAAEPVFPQTNPRCSPVLVWAK